MVKITRISTEHAEHWEHIADLSQPEVIPKGLSPFGSFDDFEYLVAPNELMNGFPFGGYDTEDTDTNETETLMIVNEFVEKQARPLLVAHLLLHKSIKDDGSPQLCAHHDKLLQSNLACVEPSLIAPFYNEATQMYASGYRSMLSDPTADKLLVDRYGRALKNTESKGRMAEEAENTRQRLVDLGLELPDGAVAINAVNRHSGARTNISLQTERGQHHTCRNCSHPIIKNTPRITTSSKEKINGYDHHHFHPGCFTHVELGIFGDIHQMPHEEAIFKH